jgi:hypothetical protein
VTPDPSAGRVERSFPRWHCWRGVAGLRYASRRLTSPPLVCRGEDTLDLMEQLQAAEHQIAEQPAGFRWPRT